MLSGVQPCFQLVSDSARDLYTFRPALPQSVFRLGRAAELCDVTLESTTVSRIHAELHAERQTDTSGEESWKVHVKDRSSFGTWVNDIRMQQGVLMEIFDGDTLIFGGQSAQGSPEFYFLFQKVRVRPENFNAITVPKASSFSSDIQNRIRTSLDCKPDPNLDISKLSINRATVILNSIGSLSKMNALVPPSTPPPLPAVTMETSSKSVPPSSKSRRKSAHTVLLEDDSSDDPVSRRSGLEDARKARGGKRRRLYKANSSPVRRRGRPRKHPLPHMGVVQGVEPCAAMRCRLPQQDTVQWVQCDDCDAWYHLDCLPHDRNRASLLLDPSADFHCGCC
uniref:FHA domain-containing protein n=1 Tax=Pygocentrus nattereri TaxID=42514 RepID=A0AAR2JUJ6_PYGNA